MLSDALFNTDTTFNQLMQKVWGHPNGFVIVEGEGEYVVTADLPGFTRDEIQVRYADGAITVSAEHHVTEEDEHLYQSWSNKRHERITPPKQVDEDCVTARLRNGVLEVRAPITEQQRNGVIEIE